ncbi:hypothetical protein AB0D22_35530 [Kitasatospora sp. NPDC048538]|uniref:hypothetical protein n=1 Tax=Kitasatospora sp. NPDC048538 TaxID=3155633 RepID=UPI0033EAF909
MIRVGRILLAVLALVFLLPAPAASAAPMDLIPKGACSAVLTPLLGDSAGKFSCQVGKTFLNTPQIVAGVGKQVAADALESTVIKPMAEGAKEFTSQVIQTSLTWWLTTPSVQVKDSGVMATEEVQAEGGGTVKFSLQAICLGVGEMIAILLVIFQGIRAIVQRKGKPLADAAKGLVINALVCTIGIMVIDSMLVASDQLTVAIIGVAFHGGDHLSELMVKMLIPTGGFNYFAMLLMALIVMLVGVIQFCMLFVRQAAIPIQALLLPIAGSGQIGGEKSRQWLPRLYTSIFTVIAYKPAAALIIAAGFVEMENSNALVDWLRGLVTLALSVIALKSLLGLFAPLGVATAGATAGGFAGALSGVAATIAMNRGGGGGGGGGGGSEPTSAVQQAAAMAKGGPAGGAAAAHPAAAAASAGIGAVQAAKDKAGGAMGGQDGGGVPQQTRQGQGETGGQTRQGQGQSQSQDQGQGQGQGSLDGGASSSSTTGAGGGSGGTPSTATPPRSTNGVQVAIVAAEAGRQAAASAGNTVSEGSQNP